MSEAKIASKILDIVWKMEKIAVDFHGKRIFREQFIKEFSNVALELTQALIELHFIGKK
ncbi:hypothetical protein ES702_07714 [subsurface metagenome]